MRLTREELDEEARQWEQRRGELNLAESAGYWRGFTSGMLAAVFIIAVVLSVGRYLHG